MPRCWLTRLRTRLVAWGTVTVALTVGPLVAEEPPPRTRALLVGCTHYPHLPESLQLRGGINDVALLRDLLVQRFGLSPADITILSEAADAAGRPTRANIVSAFEHLEQTAAPGEQLLIYLAGHGSQQPDLQPTPDDPEPDGRDELFLPSDVRDWDGQAGRVTNAILDDEFHAWLKQLEARRAVVTFLMDACHSGSMTRSSGETVRGIRAEQLIPQEVLDAAPKPPAIPAAQPSNLVRGVDRDHDFRDLPSVVALVAAQSSEVTVERLFPTDGTDRRPHGLFTYTLCSLLSRATEPLTHRELVRRVRVQYAGMGRISPTPLAEGTAADRVWLGRTVQPPPLVFQATLTGRKITLNGGALHGLTPRSLLAISAAGAAANTEAAGYLQIVEVGTIESVVVAVDREGAPARITLPPDHQCLPIRIAAATAPLSIALAEPWDGSDADRRTSKAALSALAEPHATSTADVRLVPATEADWLIRASTDGVELVSAQTWPSTPETSRSRLEPLYSSPTLSLGRELPTRLAEEVHRRQRAEQLRRLFAEGDAATGTLLKPLEIMLTGAEPPAMQAATIPQFRDGEEFVIRVQNRQSFAVDCTLLALDGGGRIELVFPQVGEPNRIQPGETQRLVTRAVGTRRSREHLLSIAVKAEGPLVEFGHLAREATRKGEADFQQSLDELANQALPIDLRNRPRPGGRQFGLQVVPWNLLPRATAPDSPIKR